MTRPSPEDDAGNPPNPADELAVLLTGAYDLIDHPDEHAEMAGGFMRGDRSLQEAPVVSDRELFVATQGGALQAAGLSLIRTDVGPQLVISDAQQLTRTLEHPAANPDTQAQLTVGLDRLFRRTLYDMSAVILARDPMPSTVRMLGFDHYYADTVYMRGSETATSMDRLMGQMGTTTGAALTERFLAAGGDFRLGQGMVGAAEAIAEGEASANAWAMASYMGLLPENRHYSENYWRGWSSIDQWQPVLKYMQFVNPDTRFYRYLQQSMRELLDEDEAVQRKLIATPFEEYRRLQPHPDELDELTADGQQVAVDESLSVWGPLRRDHEALYVAWQGHAARMLQTYDTLRTKEYLNLPRAGE